MLKKRKTSQSKAFPFIFLALAVLAAILYRSYRVSWVFIDFTIGLSIFTLILLSLMIITCILLTVLAVLRVYEVKSGTNFYYEKKAYSVLLSLGVFGAVVFLLFSLIYLSGILFTENMQIFSLNLRKTLSEGILLIIIPALLLFFPKLGCKTKKAVLVLGLVAITIFGINGYFPLSPYKITSKPMVIDNGKEYSVVFSTSDYGTAFVEYNFEGENYKIYDQTGGRLNSDTKIHNVPVPYEHLRNNSYKIGSTRVIEEFSYGSRLGKTVTSEEFTLTYNDSEDQTWLVISDWHTLLNQAHSAIANFESDYDSVILLGDATPGVDYEEQAITHIVQFGAAVSEGTKPVLYVRGNHETRGAYANDLPTALGLDQLYYTADIGPYSFVILDSGEDKDDSHHEYGGMTDYNSYRADMIDWLSSLEKRDGKTIALSHSFRISDVEKELSEKGWDELGRLDTRLIISGHHHQCRFLGQNDAEKELLARADGIVGYIDGGKIEKDFIASMLTLSKDGFEIRAVDNNNTEHMNEFFEW